MNGERLAPATQAGREYHDSLHEPGGPFEAITGRAGCGSIGCGSLSWIVAIEREAAASQGDEGLDVATLRANWPEHFSAEKAKGWIAACDRIEGLIAAAPSEAAASQGDEGLRELVAAEHASPYHRSMLPECRICAALAAEEERA